MTSGLMNLSLLSRGIGEVQQNGHEKVEVKLEPEDYFNWADDPKRLYLPPIQPKVAFESPRSMGTNKSPRETHEVHLPKTFTTRKGALLLFSEDMLLHSKHGHGHRKHRKRRHHVHSKSLDDIDFRTVEDFTKSILAYGGSGNDHISLKFLRPGMKDLLQEHMIRPGFSARRYLSSWTKCLDDSVLGKLTSQGLLSDKSLTETNPLLPNLRRRINDNLSQIPGPYRLMRQMLMSPGSLSGYMFYRMRPTTQESAILEVTEKDVTSGESPARPGDSVQSNRPDTRGTIKIFRQEGGVTQEVDYDDLDKKTKEHVLTDLLVKSAISHALKKQQEMYEKSLAEKRASISTDTTAFHMAEAIENLVNDNSNQIVIVKGAKPAPPEVAPSEQSTMQPSSGEDQSAGWPDINEQDLKKPSGKGSAASSKMSAASLSKLPAAAPAPSVDMLPSAGKGEFSKAPVLPPIQAGLTAQGPGVVPHVHIEPPTPQQSILASREQTNLTRTASQMTNSRLEEHDEEDEGLEDQEEQEQWATHVDEEEIMKKANEKSAEKKSRVPLSARSSRSKGPMAAGGPHLHSSAESLSASLNSLDDLPRVHSARSGFKASPLGSVTGKSVSSKKSIGSAQSYASHRSHKSTKSDDSHKGSVVLLNGGALSIGGAVIMKPKDSEEHLAVEVGGGDGRDSGHHSEEEEAPLHASGHARARAAPAARTKETTQQESKVTEGSSDVERQYGKYRAVDFHGGDFDATASMYTWSYNPQGESVSKFGTSVRSSTIITGHTADSVSEGLPASEYSVPPAKSSNTPAVFLEPEIRVQKSLSPGSSLGHSDVLTGLEADNQSHSHTSEAEAAAAGTESQQEAEKKLIEALTAHARAIAVSVLNKSDAGQDLEEDARLAAELWMERLPTPTQIISRSQSLKDVSYLDYEHDHDEDEAVMEIVKRRMKSAEPTAAEYRDLLRETLASVVTKGTGSPSVHSVDEVSPELIEALANKEDIRPEDLEIIQNEEGKSVIRSRTHSQSHSQSKTQSRSQSQTHSRGLSHGHSEARKGTGRSEVSQHSSHVSQSRRSSGSAVRSAVDTLERKASGQEDGHVMPEASAADQMEDVDAQVASMDLIPYAPLPPIATADDSSAQPSLPPDGSGESFKPSAPGSPAKSSKSAKSGKSAKSVKFVENVKEEKPDPVKGKKKASAKKAGETLVVTVTDDVEPELSKEEADKKVLAEVAQELAQADAKSTKSAKSDKSSKSAKSGKSAKSAKSGASKKSKTPDDKKISEKEFVVGKVENKKELEELYAQPEDPAAKDAKKPKKPSVPVVSKAKKTAPKGKKKKEAAPAKKSKAKKKVEEADEDEPPKTLTPTTVMEVKAEEGEKQSGTESPTPSHTTTESSMSFIIVRDEFEATPEPEEKSETKSRVLSSIHTEKTEEEEEGGSETESVQLKNVTDKAARERKRQADRERRKQEVERKRKEREEQIRKEKEAQEAKEKLWKEMEEERRRKEEEIRLRKEQAEEEERLAEEREKEAEKRRLAEMDREKRMKEEYVRKLEEMRKKQKLEEEKRKELERQRQEEEERLRLEEEAMLATMAEAEREEYERKKKEEAELRAKREEEERIKREEELQKQMEAAQKYAEEMARKKAEFEARMMFNRGLQVEASGLDHTQDINRAFVWSYYELLQWLGIDIPDFEKQKHNLDNL